MKIKVKTNYEIIVVQTPTGVGFATLGSDDEFDLQQGIEVALLRRYIAPATRSQIKALGLVDGDDFTAEANPTMLLLACRAMANLVEIKTRCWGNCGTFGFGRELEHVADISNFVGDVQLT